MAQPVRVGIAGYGRSGCDIHGRWLVEVPEQFTVVAVADQLPERRADAVARFDCAVYEDYRDLLAGAEIDLFINALPSLLHPTGSIEALARGFNVVSEKPSARTVADFDRVVAASEQAGKRYLPFQNSRFYPFFAKMREVIASGVLGEILHIHSNWGGFGRRWDWQTLQEFHGGNLLNTGPHPVDHAVMLFGEEMPQVFCRMRSVQPFGGDAEDYCVVVLYGDGKPTIEISLNSYLAYPPADMYVVSGAFGGLAGGANGLRWKYFDPEQAPKHEFWKPWSRNREYCRETLPWVEESWAPEDGDTFQILSRGFYNNVYDVLTHGAEPVIKLAEVRRQVAVMEECHRQNPLPRKARV